MRPGAWENHMQTSNNERANMLAVQEREIDEILADSFPASDAPPWTLGVQASTPNPQKNAGWTE